MFITRHRLPLPLFALCLASLAFASACASAPPAPYTIPFTSPETKTQAFHAVVAKEFRNAATMKLIATSTMFRNAPVVGVSHDQETRKYYVTSNSASGIVTIDANLDGGYLIVTHVGVDYITLDPQSMAPLPE